MTKLLTDDFLAKYPDFPTHMNALGQFVFYRTYSRYLPEKGRRETWKETAARATEYNVGLGVKHLEKIGYAVNIEDWRKDAENFFENMFNLRQFLSGRSLWVGGADGGVAEKYPLSNFNCFSRSTEFITDKGVKSFEDYEHGDIVNVLCETGGWREALITKFGKAEILELTVRKGKRVDVIETTDNHLWFIDKYGKWEKRVTTDLKPGDILRTKKRYETNKPSTCKVGIMHGIVFGDGTYDKKNDHCRIHLCNDKRALSKHITGGRVIEYERDNQTIITGLPNNFKKIPYEMNLEYKFGFLKGLIATDGNVSRNNTTVSSASKEVIEFVRDTAILLGITPGKMQEIEREGFGHMSKLYSINLSASDLTDDFFLRDKHRTEFKETDRVYKYRVESVQRTGRYEDVWCVQEPTTNTFTLGNGILTHNCSYVSIRSYEDLGDMFYLLLVGTGVGFRSTKEYAAQLPPIRNDVKITHKPFVQKYPYIKEPDTTTDVSNGKAYVVVGDSKEGWFDALRHLFRFLTGDFAINEIEIDYSYVRPKGARLNTFGGTASGHEPLQEMFEGIGKVIRNEIDASLEPLEQVGDNRVKLRPVHILDIGNLIGNNVVVGGVRRTAEVFLFDADDYESMLAKYGINGIWDEAQHTKVIEGLRGLGLNKQADFLASLPLRDATARPLFHRRMSNNSIWYEDKPSKNALDLNFTIMKAEGEPGLGNAAEAKRRRPNAEGTNPCFEILLDSYGVCNLTTINLVQFVQKMTNGEYRIDIDGLLEAQRMSARAGLRMTLVELEIPHWNAVQQRDRLLGLSLTGVKDAMDLLGYNEMEEAALLAQLSDVGRFEADKYAKEMRVSAPLLTTTVKPEGTISQVAGGVSSGLHVSHAPYYIRRIRINAADPLAKAVVDLGWRVHAEVGTLGYNEESDLAKPEVIAAANTLVIDFPVASGSKRTKDDVTVAEQLANYFAYQTYYTEHNSSNTISVKPHEWQKAADIVYDNWDNFVGVSFLADDGGSYRLAPYEACDKATYDALLAEMKTFEPTILQQYETCGDSDLDGADGCEAGVCPVR